MSKRWFTASGTSLATVRVFSPITQLGASGTRQPHSGHLVSVQYRKASARQPFSSCSMPHSVTCASTVWNTAFCAARTSSATFSPPPTMLSAPQVSSAATGVQVRPVGFAADARRLEGHAAATAERIPHPRHPPEAPLAQLPHQPRQTGGAGAEMRVDGLPSLRRRPIEMLRPIAPAQFLVVAHAIEQERLHLCPRLPLADGFRGLELGRLRRGRAREPTRTLGLEKPPVHLLQRNVAALAPPQSLVVHGQQRQKHLAIPARIARRGHQQPKDHSPHQNERLAPPPLAESGQRLAVVRLALLVTLLRETRDGELGLDEGWGVDGDTDIAQGLDTLIFFHILPIPITLRDRPNARSRH